MNDQEEEPIELEYGDDYTYVCKSCDKEFPCGCGNPYPETVTADHIELVDG